MKSWEAKFVLPNVKLAEPVETEFVVLAPFNDKRVLTDKNPHLADFLSRFTDTFGSKVEPSVMVVREDAPTGFHSMECLSSFRDMVSVSAVAWDRARRLIGTGIQGVSFSNAFEIYPYMLNKTGPHVSTQLPHLIGCRSLDSFHGQADPGFGYHLVGKDDLDRRLLSVLKEKWLLRFGRNNPEWTDLALFRSLKMAHRAAALPAGIEIDMYDVGVSICLWISAFEILLRHKSKSVNEGVVTAALEAVEWLEDPETPTGTTAHQQRKTATGLLGRLYKARHDFLHGNPVSIKNLSVEENESGLFQCGAPLYRLLLTKHLSLTPPPRSEFKGTSEDELSNVAEWMQQCRFQRTYQDALLANVDKKQGA